jgi:regulator of PEP synthase PpsR (kinase-PPPase family)
MNWLDAETKLLTALIEIVKTGGFYGVIAMATWMLFELLKIVAIGGSIWLIIRTLCRAVVTIMMARSASKCGAVTVLSEKVANSVSESLMEFQRKCADAVEDLVRVQNGFPTKSQEQADKPASTNG